MGHIPEDAAHWDSGDWIEWHRGVSNVDDRPSNSAAQDTLARLTAMQVSLLRSANSYYQLTGHHLPVYRAIAHVFASIHFDLPLEGPERDCKATATEILHIPPHGPNNLVEVDLSQPFTTLIVVRIKDNFKCEARMILRNKLPTDDDGTYLLNWQAMPEPT